MVNIKTIKTAKAPRAIGPYSQAVQYGNLLFCSGQIAIDPKEGELSGKTIEEQTRLVLQNLSAVLKAGGSSLDKVVKTTVYLSDIDNFSRFNKVYAKVFKKHKPARATVEVSALPKGVLIEIEAIATI